MSIMPAFARLPRPMTSLRGRVTVLAIAAMAVALAATSFVLVNDIERNATRDVDSDLEHRAASVLGPSGRAHLKPALLAASKFAAAGAARPNARLSRGPASTHERSGGASPTGRPFYAARQNLLLGSGVFARVIVGGSVVKQSGDSVGASAPPPATTGLATIDVRGRPWRTLTVAQRENALQVGESLAPALARADTTRRLVIALSLAGLLATGLVVWLLTGLALAPLQRLRRAAARIGTASDLTTRLSAARDPAEVQSLANTLNGMLARLAASQQRTEHALSATRRFAADAGHEIRTPLTSAQANLDILRRGCGPSEAARRRLLDEVSLEHHRLVELLDGLQALARGDAAGAAPRELVDVAEVLDEVVFSARRRDPLLRLHVIACPDHAWVAGWPEGIRVMIENLLRNAAVHAGPRAQVELSLHARDGRLTLTVADDGPGVPAVERTRIFERFARGTSAGRPGSGLGLAIVAQQADLHGGEVGVRESEQGGALFEVKLPAALPDGAIDRHSRTAPVSSSTV